MIPLFILVYCNAPACQKLLLEVSRDFYGVVRVKCRHCKKLNTVSLATILKQMKDEPAILPLPKRAPVQ